MRRVVIMLALIVVLVGITPAAAQDNPTQRNKETVRAALAQLSAGDLGGFLAHLTDPFLMNQGGVEVYETAPADIIPFLSAIKTAIPDLQVVPLVMVAQGDWVAAQTAYYGTFSQTLEFPPFGLEPLPPTNQAVVWTEMDFIRFDDQGQIVEMRAASDPSVMFSAFGIFPPAEAQVNGRLLAAPAGYQLLTAEEMAATVTSGRDAQALAQFQAQFATGLGTNAVPFYGDPHVAWVNNQPYEVNASGVALDQEFLSAIAAAMPDSAIMQEVVIVEGDWVAALLTITGTSTNDLVLGEMGTLPPTGQPMAWQIGTIQRYDADGTIVETWSESDPTPMLTALGLMPMMAEMSGGE